MKRFGTYGINDEHCSPYFWDVADTQNLLPKGSRIRNKKGKRRFHNKRTRTKMKIELNKEVTEVI